MGIPCRNPPYHTELTNKEVFYPPLEPCPLTIRVENKNFLKFFKFFCFLLLTSTNDCVIIIGRDKKAQRSGCGAAGSALPWGGRGRKFKSCHSDQNRRFNRTSDFLYFTGFFGFFGIYTASKTSAIFLPKIGSKSGTTTCLTTFVAKKLYTIRVFVTLRFSFLCKMTAVLCF